MPRGRHDNLGTTFWETIPLKFSRAKTVQNSARFWTTLDFDREYLRNRWRNRKSEKQVVNCDLSHVPRKTFGELWSTNKPVIGAHVDPPKKNLFFVDYISAPSGCCPVKLELEHPVGEFVFIAAGTKVRALKGWSMGSGVPSPRREMFWNF